MTQQQEYQCSWCKRNKFNGDESCPLNLEGSNGNSDIFDGVNRVIKSCGCGSFIDTRRSPAPQQPVLYAEKPDADDPEIIQKIALCLCEQCKVNGFLCQKSPRAISPEQPPASADAVLDAIAVHGNYLSMNALSHEDWNLEMKKFIQSLREGAK